MTETHSLFACSIVAIQREIADYYDISIEDMRSKRRARCVARPRQIGMYIARRLLKISYPRIAKCFGKSDHTTIIHAFRKVDELRKVDLEIDNFISRFGI